MARKAFLRFSVEKSRRGLITYNKERVPEVPGHGGIMNERRSSDRVKPEMQAMRGTLRLAEANGAIPKGTVCSIKHEPDGAGGGTYRIVVRLPDPLAANVHPVTERYLAHLMLARVRRTLNGLSPSLDLVVVLDPATENRFGQRDETVAATGHVSVDGAGLEAEGYVFSRLAIHVETLVKDALAASGVTGA
jgi:hypothetical protein